MRVASLRRVGLWCWCVAWPLPGGGADRVAATRAHASQAVSASCHCNQNFCPPSGSDTYLQIRRAPRSAATWVDVTPTSSAHLDIYISNTRSSLVRGLIWFISLWCVFTISILNTLNKVKARKILVDGSYSLPLLVVSGYPSKTYVWKILVICSVMPISTNIASFFGTFTSPSMHDDATIAD